MKTKNKLKISMKETISFYEGLQLLKRTINIMSTYGLSITVGDNQVLRRANNYSKSPKISIRDYQLLKGKSI